MFRNSSIPSVNAWKRVSRWRRIFIALVLALVIGSVAQTPTAQAAPAGETQLLFTMRVVKELEGPICKGDLLHISVTVQRNAEDIGDPGDELMSLGTKITGVEIKGLVKNPGIGQISPASNTTIVEGAMTPNSADFIFTAENYGETSIAFRGLVATPGWFGTNWRGGSQPVSNFVHVQVIPCKFEVTTVSNWDAGMTIRAMIDGAVMKAADVKTDRQVEFKGTATVNWVTNILCGIASPIAPSRADLTGRLNENGQLVGEITFAPVSSTGGGNCILPVGTSNFASFDQPLKFTASTEGTSVSTQAQTVTAENGSFTGTATIVVIPKEDEAAALNPVDDFSSIFGALLALH